MEGPQPAVADHRRAQCGAMVASRALPASEKAANSAERPEAGPLRRVAVTLLTLSFFTVTWNAVYVAGVQPADALLLLAFLAAAGSAVQNRHWFRIPRAMLVGASLIGVAGLVSELFPPAPGYLLQRYAPTAHGLVTSGDDITELFKFEVALLLVPLTVGLLRPSLRELRRLANVWAISALATALVAATDAVHITDWSVRLHGLADTSGRQAGLSAQENHLALALVLTAPIVISWLVSPRFRTRLLAVPALGLMSIGILLSGSRGGFVVALFAVIAACMLAPRLRRVAKWLAVLAPLLLIGVYVFAGSVFTGIAVQSRLAAGLGANSDYARNLLQSQALHDLQSSPIYGIGYNFLASAHEVHLQLVAAGGAMALSGYGVYWLSTLVRGWQLSRIDQTLAPLLVASVLSFLLINFAENQVADRYLYVPAALLGAMFMRRLPRSTEGEKRRVDPHLGQVPWSGVNSPEFSQRR